LVDIVKKSAEFLEKHGSDTPRLDAEILIAMALRMQRLDLYLQFDRLLTDDELTVMRLLLRRRADGEPVAYITGFKEFYGRKFKVTKDTLIPRPETELLVERTLHWAKAHGGPMRIADVGTGSGCIAVTLACELPDSYLFATDISELALEVARENAVINGVNSRISFAKMDLLDGAAEVDAVVSNLPYITTEEMANLPEPVLHEPRLALEGGADGLDLYRRLVAALPKTVCYVALEVDPRRADAVAELLTPGSMSCAVHKDLAGHERVVEAVRD
jgi:release factor glutamine methyltransferase